MEKERFFWIQITAIGSTSFLIHTMNLTFIFSFFGGSFHFMPHCHICIKAIFYTTPISPRFHRQTELKNKLYQSFTELHFASGGEIKHWNFSICYYILIYLMTEIWKVLFVSNISMHWMTIIFTKTRNVSILTTKYQTGVIVQNRTIYYNVMLLRMKHLSLQMWYNRRNIN